MPKLITVSENLLKDILHHFKGTPLEKKIKDLINNTGKYQTQNITFFPKKAKAERVVDGDTIVLNNGSIVRYVGITAPENNEPFEKESTEVNVSIELVRLGMAQVVIYQHKKPFIYQDQLLKAQEETKKNNRGIWK